MTDIVQSILADLVRDLFDQRIMSNLFRPHYVERLVQAALGDDYRLVSADWAGWDIDGPNGLRIEVKQSAARQTWTDRPSLGGKLTRGTFDIAPRTGYYDHGGDWVPSTGRPAHIYIFAWHPIGELEHADHRDPTQWRFFVVATDDLPRGQKTISLGKISQASEEIDFAQLRSAVERLASEVRISA
jgi:hypothetical protein